MMLYICIFKIIVTINSFVYIQNNIDIYIVIYMDYGNVKINFVHTSRNMRLCNEIATYNQSDNFKIQYKIEYMK